MNFLRPPSWHLMFVGHAITAGPDDAAPPLSPIDGLPVIYGDYYDGERD